MRSEIRLLGQGDSICGLWEFGASIFSLSCTLPTCYHLFSLILTQRSVISAHLQPSSQNLNELTPSSSHAIFSLTITSASYLFIYLLLLFVGILTSQKPSHQHLDISLLSLLPTIPFSCYFCLKHSSPTNTWPLPGGWDNLDLRQWPSLRFLNYEEGIAGVLCRKNMHLIKTVYINFT